MVQAPLSVGTRGCPRCPYLHCEKFWIPPKFVMGPEEPPETLSADQSQAPLQEPEPQLTATRIASLFTERELVSPMKLTS